jgi:RNA polymerase subunit RPABC4/transcription elongation factor Spt4
MRYCYNCNRITAGKPLFCNFCGRSYNVKLCPRLHPNPRKAEACSQCGSRDLSTPQPKVPLWVPVLELCLSLVPGLVLGVLSIGLVALLFKAIFENPRLLLATVFLAIALGVLWWMWSKIPLWFRRAVSNLLRRRREGERRRGRR